MQEFANIVCFLMVTLRDTRYSLLLLRLLVVCCMVGLACWHKMDNSSRFPSLAFIQTFCYRTNVSTPLYLIQTKYHLSIPLFTEITCLIFSEVATVLNPQIVFDLPSSPFACTSRQFVGREFEWTQWSNNLFVILGTLLLTPLHHDNKMMILSNFLLLS